MTNDKLTILIADELPIVKIGLKKIIIENHFAYRISDAYNEQGIWKLLESEDPNILITDIIFNHSIVIDEIEKIRHCYPKMYIIIYTNNCHDYLINRFRKHANLMVTYKDGDIGMMIQCLHEIVQSTEGIKPTKNPFNYMTYIDLTEREREILDLISNGMTTSEISELLFISKHTVESHRKNLFLKLGVKNVAEMIRKGFQMGVIN